MRLEPSLYREYLDYSSMILRKIVTRFGVFFHMFISTQGLDVWGKKRTITAIYRLSDAAVREQAEVGDGRWEEEN
jgi:hypothetical protein